MDKQLMSQIFKTKPGKIGIVFIVLSVLSLCTCFMSVENLGTGILGCILFFFVSGIFFLRGKKAVENSEDGSASAPASPVASAPAPKKVKFKPTKKIEKYFYVDDVNKQWCVPCSKESKAVYNFSDLLDYELIENGNTVTSVSLGRAIAGGLAFGGLGAVIGGMTGKQKPTCDKLQIKITVKDIKHPALYITLIDFEVKKDGMIYQNCIRSAQEIVSMLQVIKSINE